MFIKSRSVLKFFSLLLLSALYSSNIYAHKFYMSITDAVYNKENKSLEIVVKFFADDVEEMFSNDSSRFYLNDSQNLDSTLLTYVSQHFLVKNNNKAKAINWIGNEYDQDYLWVYFEIKHFNPNKTIELSNTLLLEKFPEQQNKINIEILNHHHSHTFHKDSWVKEF